jgi:hypothetical protein
MTTPTTNLQQSPYLREQRQFPNDELRELATQVDQAYIDIAQKMNARTIGIYAVNFQTVTGESWYLRGSSNRQQTLRQVYTFTAAGNIPHGINFATISQFTKCQGSYTDGTNWYGVIFATSVAIAGEVSFYITPTNIVVLMGGGAPAITSGSIILEWLSQV